MELAGKVAVVTGGANGIGAALCRRFVAEGAAAVAIVDLDGDAAKALAAELGESAFGLAADVGREDDIVAAIRASEARAGAIDLLVCNAGIGAGGGVEAPDEVWQRAWDVHVMHHVWAIRAVLPAMLERGEGYVLTTASAAGLLTNIGAAPYSVTKHAAVGLAEWLSITHGDQGLKVSCLCPQGVRTDLLMAGAHDAAGAVVLAQGAIEPEDVAEAVIEGLRAERFLILPHPEVADHERKRAGDRDRWLAGMRRLQRRIRDAVGR